MVIRGVVLGLALFVWANTVQADARWWAQLEMGGAVAARNDVRIPGDQGTRFSLSDDLQSRLAPALRTRLGWRPGARHELIALAAPLRIRSSGTLEQDTRFADTVFPAGTEVDAFYRFDSYRLTYRFRLLETNHWLLALGATGKVRSANIRLRGDGFEDDNPDLGVVPLIHWLAEWNATPLLGLRVEGDGLAAPQGRALDNLTAFTFRQSPSWELYAGWRVLEGGSDIDEVFTFALVHYGVVGGSFFW